MEYLIFQSYFIDEQFTLPPSQVRRDNKYISQDALKVFGPHVDGAQCFIGSIIIANYGSQEIVLLPIHPGELAKIKPIDF